MNFFENKYNCFQSDMRDFSAKIETVLLKYVQIDILILDMSIEDIYHSAIKILYL